MAILIGIDEAGLGPYLGPYVVTATVWEVPGDTDELDLWDTFAEVLTCTPCDGDARLHIGDSKAVYQPGKGLAVLERGVLAAAGLLSEDLPATDQELRCRLAYDREDHHNGDPWYASQALPLPTANDRSEIRAMAECWRSVLQRVGIRLRCVRFRVLEPKRFNRLIAVHQNKAAALSTISLQLLRDVVRGAEEQPVFAWCDKHGGRNRYDLLLSACFDDAFVFRLRESADLSTYRVGSLEVRFLPRAESILPVALASMVSKYVRELAMQRFNRFWTEKIPGLRPTAGYPTDAWRFREAIASEQRRLKIPDKQLWRCR